ncbi:MFS-type transporter-like protein 47 [Elsinoe fawcettii]|nr:MFS-type transporter-like protein 47 [Elsinoe fawcettii]
MAGYQFNLLVTSFFVAYIIFDIPATWLCKLRGPHVFLPWATIFFGLCTLVQAFVNRYWQVVLLRVLLGICEAGMLPGIAYYLSRWFTQADLTFYLSWVIFTAPIAGALGGLLASGLLRLGQQGPIRTWRWIFLVEGAITVAIGVVTIFLIPEAPDQKKTLRWLSAEDATVLGDAIKGERGDSIDKRESPAATLFRLALSSPVTFITSFIFLFNSMTVQGLGVFAPTIVRGLFPTKTVIQQQLLTVPPYFFAAIVLLLTTALSRSFNQRCIFMTISAIPVAVGFCLLVTPVEQPVKYAAMFLGAGAFAFGALCNSQVSANTRSDTARNFAMGSVTTLGNVGGLLSAWIYLPGDAPGYRLGHSVNLGGTATILLLSLGLQRWMMQDNRRREQDLHPSPSYPEDISRPLSVDRIESKEWKDGTFRWKT